MTRPTPEPFRKAHNLLPCPFCGGAAYDDGETAEIMGKRTKHRFAVACANCEASAPSAGTYEEAAVNWNTRAVIAAAPQPSPAPAEDERAAMIEAIMSAMSLSFFEARVVADALFAAGYRQTHTLLTEQAQPDDNR
ncbi:Lar family restriction alleviation protein [Paracoccus aeridis]|uniref:Lar family restriction alleviation protein n=1 Tax=Paracoccus aeridis TaxID=1966466 RepID=UPI00137587A0|nr:Lar family restriction alleviation protein [Paracoccus aeridis]